MCYGCAVCKCRIFQAECFFLLPFVRLGSMETLDRYTDSARKGKFYRALYRGQLKCKDCPCQSWSYPAARLSPKHSFFPSCFLHSSRVRVRFMPLEKAVLLLCPQQLCRMLYKVCARSPVAIWNLLTRRWLQFSLGFLLLSFSPQGISSFKVTLYMCFGDKAYFFSAFSVVRRFLLNFNVLVLMVQLLFCYSWCCPDLCWALIFIFKPYPNERSLRQNPASINSGLVHACICTYVQAET